MMWRQVSNIRVAIIDEMVSPVSPLMGYLGTHRELFSKMSRLVLPCPTRDIAEKIPLSGKGWIGALDFQPMLCGGALGIFGGTACGEGKSSGWSMVPFSALGFCISYFSCHHD